MSGSLPIQRRGVTKLSAVFTAFILVVVNSSLIRGSDVRRTQSSVVKSKETPRRRRLLRDSSCTLYRKCVTYGGSDFHHNDTWACQLSPEDSEYLDADFLDIVNPSSAVSAALENATSGESTLNIRGAIADTDRMEMYVQDDASVEAYGRNIILSRTRVPPSKTGLHKLLVIRITDGNNLSPEPTTDQIYKNIFDDDVSLKSQMNRCSYGKLQIEPFAGKTPTQQIVDNGIVNINVTGVTSDDDTFVQAAKRAAREKLGNLNDPRFGLVMFCLPKGPRGIAWAYANHKFSFYSNKWCGAVASTMHEIGHNIGLGHSGEVFQGDSGDGIGLMGRNPGRGDVRMCYNPQKSYQLGWYDDKTKSINPLDGKGRRTFTLNGVAQYKRKNKALVVLRLEQVSKTEDFYIGFNNARGINRDTLEDKGKLVIIRKEKGGPKEYSQSTKIASLIPGETYVIRNFNNADDVRILFKGLKNGNAKIIVVDNDKKRPTTVAGGKCKKFTIEISTDNNPKDTAWYITNKFGKVIDFSQKYRTRKQRVIQEVCLPMLKKQQRYKFTILDDKGDGMCCRRGKGYYRVIDENGQTILEGGRFSKTKTHTILVPRDPSLYPTNEPSMSPSMIPTTLCVDNSSFSYNGKKGKNCKWVAAKRTSNRCKKTNVKENCRATCDPSCQASSLSATPSSFPINVPSFEPSVNPFDEIGSFPSSTPSVLSEPNDNISWSPIILLSNAPSENPSSGDVKNLSISPSNSPSSAPTKDTTLEIPLADHSYNPSTSPSVAPSTVPSMGVPSETPHADASQSPSENQSISPSSASPMILSSDHPSIRYSEYPSESPLNSLSSAPSTEVETNQTRSPSISPSIAPSVGVPSDNPSINHSHIPSNTLSISPSGIPSRKQSDNPSQSPSEFPNSVPSTGMPPDLPPSNHTIGPSFSPSSSPSIRSLSTMPSNGPSSNLSKNPSYGPSMSSPSTPSARVPLPPSTSPSTAPSSEIPSESPSFKHSKHPSESPSRSSIAPSEIPSSKMSDFPTKNQSNYPSIEYTSGTPSQIPSLIESNEPSEQSSRTPSFGPSMEPTFSNFPSARPSKRRTFSPTTTPSSSSKPSTVPTVSNSPTAVPSSSSQPSGEPTGSFSPTAVPSFSSKPSNSPTASYSPSYGPSTSSNPSSEPSNGPSLSLNPSNEPSHGPRTSSNPSDTPSSGPSLSSNPSNEPSHGPRTSSNPSDKPSSGPSLSSNQSNAPTAQNVASTSPTIQLPLPLTDSTSPSVAPGGSTKELSDIAFSRSSYRTSNASSMAIAPSAEQSQQQQNQRRKRDITGDQKSSYSASYQTTTRIQQRRRQSN